MFEKFRRWFNSLDTKQKRDFLILCFLLCWFIFNLSLNFWQSRKQVEEQNKIDNLSPVAVIDKEEIKPEPTPTADMHPSSQGGSNSNTQQNNQVIDNSNSDNEVVKTGDEMELYFLDTGNSDASLLKLPDGTNILFDCGDYEDGQAIVDFLESHDVWQLDDVVISHMHRDHFGSCAYIAQNIPVQKWYMPEIPEEYIPTSRSYQILLEYLIASEADVTSPNSSDVIESSDNYKIFFLNSSNNHNWGDDQNAYSLVVMIEYGTHKYIIGGDALTANEKEILNNWSYYDFDIDVYKGHHHCSKTSNSEKWLSTITPEYVVCPVGANNSYGHPHPSVLKLFDKYKITVLRSDKDGTVLVLDNGKEYVIQKGLESVRGE